MKLDSIGYGLDPLARRAERAKYLAHAFMPYLKDSIRQAKEGKVRYNDEMVETAFAALDALALEVEASTLDEGEKLLVNGACSFILHAREAGTLSSKKLKIAIAIADTCVGLFGDATDILGIDIEQPEP